MREFGKGILIGAVLTVGFVGISLLFMVLANVVLNHYDIKTLNLGASMAIVAINALFLVARPSNSNSKQE